MWTILKSKINTIQFIIGNNNKQETTIIKYTFDIENEINDAATFLKEGKAAEAINLLERLWRKHNDKMSDRLKYRTQANIGAAYNQMDNFEEAARYWLIAYQYEKNYEEAQARQALAYLYQGKKSRARDIAKKVLEKNEEILLARLVWIKTFSKTVSLEEIISQIPEHQKKDSDILLSLAFVASGKEDWSQAEKFLTEALDENDGHPIVQERLGKILFQKVDMLKCILTEKKPTSNEELLIKKGIEYISDACNEWNERKNLSKTVELKLLLAKAFQALGNNTEAENNIKLAYELDKTSEMVLCEYAALIANGGETDKAIGLLAELCEKSELLAVVDLYAQLLKNRNKEGDKIKALEILKKRDRELEGNMSFFCFEYVRQTLLFVVEVENEDNAINYLEGLTPDLLSFASVKILKSIILSLGQNRDKAIEIAIGICEDGYDNLDYYEKINLAELLQSLNQWNHALKVWQEVTPDDCLDKNTFNLLKCAHRADNPKTIISFCEKLRNNQVWDDRIVNLELDYRLKYNDNDVAIEIMDKYLLQCQDEDVAAMIRLRRSCLGLKIHNYDLLEYDRNKLPDVATIIPHNGGIVVQILVNSSNPVDGVDYGYDLWRLNPDDENANLAFISTLLPIGPKIELPEYDIVQVGVAVLYEDEKASAK